MITMTIGRCIAESPDLHYRGRCTLRHGHERGHRVKGFVWGS